MSYIITITLRRCPADDSGEGEAISEEEWKALVLADPSLVISRSEYTMYKSEGADQISHPVRWVPHPFAAFTWRGGEITVANPDKATTMKAIDIAERLGAKVQGQDGEFYTGPEDYDRYAIYGPNPA